MKSEVYRLARDTLMCIHILIDSDIYIYIYMYIYIYKVSTYWFRQISFIII